MEEYNCRTCLATTDRKKCTQITKKCYLEKTIKDVIIYLVPEMEPTLSDEELICKSCLQILKLVMQFIEGCLEVEAIKVANKKYFQDGNDDVSDNGDGETTMDDIQIKQEGQDQYLDETADETYQDDYNEDQKMETSKLKNDVKVDHDYSNKPNIVYEYDNDSNLVDYDSAADETAYSSSSIQDGRAEGERVRNYSRPIEIVYHDSLMINDDQEGTDSQDGNDTSEAVYVEYQSDENLVLDEKKILACSTCSEVFTSDDAYQMHLEIHPEASPQYKCQYCDKRLTTEIAYKSHLLWHNEKGFRMCEFCGRCFKSSGALHMHISCTHLDTNTYSCDHCDKQYKQKFKLLSHIKSVHLKIGRQECQECGRLFQNKEACENHYRLIHLNIKPFVCEICGMGFGRKDYLQKHLCRHANETSPKVRRSKETAVGSSRIRLRNPGKPVTCKVCGKLIKTVHLLKAHLQTHVRIKRHKCKFCELTFTLSTNRDRHEKLHESDPDNKFRCNICWKRVKTEEDLERHVAGHRNRPPQHSCDICGEKFHRRYLVDNHLLDKHTGPGDIEKAEEEIVFKNLLEYVDPKLLQ